jgi:hypothetical protein
VEHIVKEEPGHMKQKTESPKVSLVAQILDDDDDDDIEILDAYQLTKREIAQQELSEYMRQQKLPMDANPIEYWQSNQTKFPLLASLMEVYAVVQATSVASERVFSTAGDVVSAQRACLEPNQVDALIFLKKNTDWS